MTRPDDTHASPCGCAASDSADTSVDFRQTFATPFASVGAELSSIGYFAAASLHGCGTSASAELSSIGYVEDASLRGCGISDGPDACVHFRQSFATPFATVGVAR